MKVCVGESIYFPKAFAAWSHLDNHREKTQLPLVWFAHILLGTVHLQGGTSITFFKCKNIYSYFW